MGSTQKFYLIGLRAKKFIQIWDKSMIQLVLIIYPKKMDTIIK